MRREALGYSGFSQLAEFTWALVRDELDQRLRHSPGVRAVREELRAEVLAGELPATVAADRLLAAFDADPSSGPGSEPDSGPSGDQGPGPTLTP